MACPQSPAAIRIIAVLLFLVATSIARADDERWVYRIDSRNPSQIFYSTGFQPWGQNENIIQHVSGDSILDQTSIYVATTTDLEAIRTMGRLFLDLDPELAQWVYYIRPGNTFYNVGNSLVRNAAVAETQELFDRYMSLYYHYEWQAEVAARGGIRTDQIYGARPVMRRIDGGIDFGPFTFNINYDPHPSAVINNGTLPGDQYSPEEVLFEEGASASRPISLAFPPSCERSRASRRARDCRYHSAKIETFIRRTKAREGLLSILHSD